MIRKMILMSIKPEYMHEILEGDKQIELRRTKPRVSEGDLVVFYVSSPQKMIRGAASVKRVIEGTPSQIWETYSDSIGIAKQNYDEYFSGAKKAFGIMLDTIWAYANPIGLQEMRGILVNFSPPRSYRYLSSEERKIVENLERESSLTKNKAPHK